MAAGFWLVARDKPGLLIAMMRALAGEAHISFEGDLSRCDFTHLPHTDDGTAVGLPRETPYPQLDFVVLPLEPDTIRPILDQVLPEARVVHDVIHIQIAKRGRREFGAYDNFHPECIVCGPLVPVSLLEDLHHRGVLRAYFPAEEDQLNS
jgi:hypothetical protein